MSVAPKKIESQVSVARLVGAEREVAPYDSAPRPARAPGLRFVSAELFRRPGSTIHVQVKIERAGHVFDAQAEGVGLEAFELRLAAQATLAAVNDATGGPGFKLLGIKRLHAFDADVVLVSLRDQNNGGYPLIGAVPVRGGLAYAAALAVLSAVPATAVPVEASGQQLPVDPR